MLICLYIYIQGQLLRSISQARVSVESTSSSTGSVRWVVVNNMSKRLRDCDSYLRILLSGNRIQGEALLVTASDKQVECIGEIVTNLLQLPVSKKTQGLIHQYEKILKPLADRKLSTRKRLDIIQKSHVSLLDVLLSVKSKLLPLLSLD